ncbi:condensation domain-containing protein [Chelativorans sp. AA-79]|uniref:condensation domain-containing protein n=1 Tax=Chelativorans sp. AA-79 TaxID=3028735 RepID=UPI0023F8F850|nr:condensation domain-containing protein [Chelativorans sp. AA-79]WEX10486.1 condensation domain-containing protein [Chelativorans sp. AA-79]
MNMMDLAGAPAENPRRVIAEFPCTQTQLRCWFLDQLKPGNPALNVAVRWEIRGAFKIASIEEAFRKVIERHEILRTRFADVDGQPVQQVVDSVDFRMSVIDLRNVPASQRDERIQSISRETAGVPFDLREPGLFRVTFLMVENNRGLILITAHQSCFDGWSIRILGREVGEMASAIDSGRTPTLPELPLQYGDFALWQAEYRQSYGFEAEKAYWRRQLADAPYFEIRPDRPRGGVKTNRGDIVSVAMPLEFGERINLAARGLQVSLFSHGAAVISAALHRFSGERQILFGTQIAGREDVDLENLIGVFINNLVLRFDASDELSFAEHVRRAGETVESALNHQRMPFNNLVELINPARDPARNPLVSINFNQQKAFLEDARYGGFELISSPSQSPGVIYDLNFIMIGRPNGWRMSVEYNMDLFDAATAKELLRVWQETYEMALERPEATLGSFGTPPSARLQKTAPSGELGGIEALLGKHPDIQEAAAIRTDDGGIYAFVAPSPSLSRPLETLPAFLMDHLANRLPAKDMPAGVSVLLMFPRTPAGDIDRQALKAPSPGPLPARERPISKPAPDARSLAPAKEHELARIWANVLGVDEVKGSDDFFALGGHSLLALRMFSAMREAFGVKPELSLLFKAPTLAAFCREVFGEEAATAEMPTATAEAEEKPRSVYWETSVYRKGNGACTVYTLNHPLLYYHMANALADGPSVVNLHMFGAELDDELRRMSIEEIVADAIRAMDLRPGSGPLVLVGLCINGLLAIEMARQLRGMGHDVDCVAMIDTWAPGYFRALPRLRQSRWKLERRVKRLAYFTGRLLRGRIRLMDYLKEFNLSQKLLGRLSSAAALTKEEVATEAVTELLVNASRSYRLQPVMDEEVLLFRSQAHHKRARKLLFGWRGFIREDSAVHDVEGWHEDSLTSAGIESLAGTLSRRLAAGG